MSLEKSIEYGKEYRKAYRGSKQFDRTCRNHGSCNYCVDNRTYASVKRSFDAQNQIDDFWYDEDQTESLE